MRINFNRLSQLAGIPVSSNRGLNEGMEPKMEMEGDKEEAYTHEGTALEGLDEEEVEEEDKDMDEVLDIDETMLVQELRRAKRIMQESKRKRLNESRKQNMFEVQLKKIIDEEVQNVMDEMNLTAGWVYGDRRPTRSRQGYTHQGSTIPGIGFRNR